MFKSSSSVFLPCWECLCPKLKVIMDSWHTGSYIQTDRHRHTHTHTHTHTVDRVSDACYCQFQVLCGRWTDKQEGNRGKNGFGRYISCHDSSGPVHGNTLHTKNERTQLILCYSVNTVKDSFSFCADLQDFGHVGDNVFMCSFDVVSLFTNVPIDEAIQICLDTLYRSDIKQPKISEELLKKLLYKATRDVEFSF